MIRFIALFFMVWMLGCGEECPTGDPCDRQCPQGVSAVCTETGTCACGRIELQAPMPMADAGPVRDAVVVEQRCRMAEPGEIVINELVIDGEPTEDREFVELVNRTEDSLSLVGLRLLSTRSSGLTERLRFRDGCIAPKGAVALFSQVRNWVWNPEPEIQPTVIIASFGFPNNSDFRFVLRDNQDRIIDEVEGLSSMIPKGVSLNRDPDLVGENLTEHRRLAAGIDSSPARCSNLGTFANDCVDGDQNLVACPLPQPGQLVINEVLIDGEPDESDEFIELVNASETVVALAGLTIVSNRGDGENRRVFFTSGCIYPGTAIGMYHDLERWVWSGEVRPTPEYEVRQFQFSNSADFRFRLLNEQEEALSVLEGPSALIEPGVSLSFTRTQWYRYCTSQHRLVSGVLPGLLCQWRLVHCFVRRWGR